MKINNIAIAGINELDAQLARLSKAVSTDIGESAVRGAAEALAEKWVVAAPYDPAPKIKSWTTRGGQVSRASYGHLRENIRVSKIRSVKVTWIGWRVTTGDAFWGYFQEFGWQAGSTMVPARPWARPATDAFKPQMEKLQIDLFNQGIADALAGRPVRKHGKMMANGRNA
jgi:hypothetical protein